MNFYPNFIFRSPISPALKKMDRSIFTEALYLSTPALYDELQKHLLNVTTNQKDLKKLNISIYKYESRSSQRCTPFGLFAGLGIGEWNKESEITLHADLTKSLNRKTRLDMNVHCSLVQEFGKKDFIKPHLKFYPNTSIYLVGNSYRYIEYYYLNSRRFHKINKVDFSEYLQFILAECKKGLTRNQLVNLLVNDEITHEEASNFIEELIQSQLLINQFEPTLTGPDYFDVLKTNLHSISNANSSSELRDIINTLTDVDSSLKKIDSALFNDISTYKSIHQTLKSILPELSETNLFQADLYKQATNNTLSSALQEQLKNVITFLNKINATASNKNLDEFKKRFYDRYEDDEIPLLLALDTETGVGYPAIDKNGLNNLVEDIFTGNFNTDSEIKWNQLQAYLLKLIRESIKRGQKVIQISEADFSEIDYSTGVLPTSYSVMFKVLNATTNKIFVNSIGGSSAIYLLGRFAGGDQQLHQIVTEIAKFEQTQIPDKILAEIVHLPESRTGNILARTSFRNYEIPYLAKSSVGEDFQIKMDDLFLKMDKDNNLVLFDKRLQKEIIPRLGNAHNYSFNSLPVYHFLCDLQSQYFTKPHIGFDWGVLANQFNFLPRVEFQNTVLSPAKWQLKKRDLKELQDKKKSDEEKRASFFELKGKIDLPSKFLIADGDNELLIDCNNPIAVDTFIDSTKNRSELILEEYLFEHDHALIKDTEGNLFTNECIAIVLNENPYKESAGKSISKTQINKKHTFSIGSEWLFYKIYCGVKTADLILTEKLKPIADHLLREEIIDNWFFIRYADPENHLRFRMHICDSKKYGEVLQLVHNELEPLMADYLISKIQTDTYKQELERYGENSIELAEKLFHNDSVFVARMVELLDPESGGDIRWQMALRSVDEFLNDLAFTLEEKYEFINQLSIAFFKEHGGSKDLKILLDDKFRKLRSKVDTVLTPDKDNQMEYFPIIELLTQRSLSNAPILRELKHLITTDKLQVERDTLLASLLHMNLDRLFMGRNRTNEFVIYDLLARYYKSSLARTKTKLKEQKDTVQ